MEERHTSYHKVVAERILFELKLLGNATTRQLCERLNDISAPTIRIPFPDELGDAAYAQQVSSYYNGMLEVSFLISPALYRASNPRKSAK